MNTTARERASNWEAAIGLQNVDWLSMLEFRFNSTSINWLISAQKLLNKLDKIR